MKRHKKWSPFGAHLSEVIASATATNNDDSTDPRSELDSHANMNLLGKHAYIFDKAPE